MAERDGVTKSARLVELYADCEQADGYLRAEAPRAIALLRAARRGGS